MDWFHVSLFLTLFSSSASCAKILGVFPMPAHSHFTLGFQIMKELADRGHEVTYINPFPQKQKLDNFRDVSVANIVEEVERARTNFFDFGQMTFINQLEFARTMGVFLTEEVLKNDHVQNLIHSNETFDLVLLENFISEGLSVFSHIYKCPLVLLGPGPITMYNDYLFANPSPSSYVPNILTDLVVPLSFWQRIQNSFYNIAASLFHHLITIPGQDSIMKKYVKDAPNLQDHQYKVDLMLLASHVSLNDPHPLQANIKEIGGYHVKKPRKLPNDLQEYLDSAKEGVVLFSMGSNLRCSDFPKEKLDAVLKTFGKLKQKILWKLETDLPEKPDNVRIMKWLPQNDVLAHRNIKAFIGHGGLLSTMETIYHGVPMVGVPVFWDQKLNMKTAEKRGFAVAVPFVELNEEKFTAAINKILHNRSYSENAKHRSKIMHSDPVKPLDSAIFWLEYVMQFKGAAHLRSAGTELKWYQLYNIDVLVFILTLELIFIATLCFIVKKIRKTINLYTGHPAGHNKTKLKKL